MEKGDEDNHEKRKNGKKKAPCLSEEMINEIIANHTENGRRYTKCP